MRMRRRLAAVERRDLVGLDGARREDGIGTTDDGRLGLGAPVGHVGLHLLGHRLCLHAVERVERAHQREVQLVLDHVARQAREPVVGVDGRVGQVAARVAAGHGCGGHTLEHPVGELVDDGGEGLLGQRLGGAGGDVVHAQAGLDVDHRREAGRPRPREHVAGDARAGQGGGQLADVDVHAAAVTRSGLGQGRGVQREDGEAAHGGQEPTGAGQLPPAPSAGCSVRLRPSRRGRPGPAAPSRRVERGRAGHGPARPARPRTRGGRRDRSAPGPASAPR